MSDMDTQGFTDIIDTLEQLEHGLVAYEEQLQAGRSDPSQIHILFRFAHNLKSSLGMVRKSGCSELIHAVENKFDLIRSGKMELQVPLIDSTLEAIDLIKENLFRETETGDELRNLKLQLEQMEEPQSESQPDGEITFPLEAEVKKAVARDVAEGKSIYQIEKLIGTGLSREEYEDLPIYRTIGKIGTLLQFYPPYDELDRKSEEAVVAILFSTTMTDDDLYFEIFDPMRRIEFQGIESSVPEGGSPPDSVHRMENEEWEPPSDLNILIVEDDFTTRHAESRILGKYGACDIAVNGAEAVRAFEEKHRRGERYDLILLDIMMPELDGHEVLEQIREYEAAAGISGLQRSKVIIVSVLRDMENIFKSFRGQSDSYIIKPVTGKKVEREIRRLQFG